MKSVAAIVAILASQFAPGVGHAQVINPGYEKAASSQPTFPEGWAPLGPREAINLDENQKFSGDKSLRLERRGDFVGVAQSVSAGPYRGAVIRLTAHIKGLALGSGDAGIWLRGVDRSGKTTFFSTTYDKGLRGTAGWVAREIVVMVPASTERLVFGPALGADGTIWVDALELSSLDDVPVKPLTAKTKKHLDDAINIVQKNAYYSDRVNWSSTRRAAAAVASGASTFDGVHSAIEFVLSSLGDGHSRLLSPKFARETLDNSKTTELGVVSRSVRGHGYILVPEFPGTNKARSTAFADEIQGRISAMDAPKSCGWIVDLRTNSGGNMYPMISGLSPLIGDGQRGYFLGKSTKEPWQVVEGRSGMATEYARSTAYRAVRNAGKAPVAVLVGPMTASSGEAVLISFIGGKNVRTFGQPTAGFLTANATYPLVDGARIALTTSIMADRTGKAYGGPISPDQLVTQDAPAANGKDSAIEAASAWIEQQDLCN